MWSYLLLLIPPQGGLCHLAGGSMDQLFCIIFYNYNALQVPLPGYIEAYPRPRYQHNSPSRLPRQYSQQASMHPSLEQAPLPSTAASQQSLTENDPSDAPLTNISTAALVKAIREEVAKLAKKQTDMFEFQV